GSYIANSIIKLMCKKGTKINGGRALVLGLTFKENCPDLRNSKVIDIITELSDFGLDVEITDPHASSEEALREYDVSLAKDIKGKYDVVVGAVAHNEFKNLSLSNHCHDETVIFDVKGFLDRSLVDKRL
ncbi:MAG: UDP binding domain-containing protein, partial [Bacteroidota bacterium]